ncbi:MAG: peptidoglycan-binding protein [Ilumatobacter sp.]|nr:peptidoglycan-binding protein [Ilumatobacter sp.]
MRRAAVAGAVVVVLAAGGTTAAVLATRDNPADTASASHRLATVEVQRRDLVIYDETTATLGFTASVSVGSPIAGTVTSLVASGASVGAGTVVASIDGSPVVTMIGDVPTYRDLSTDSDDGIDVRQLETNLVMLGFDPDGEITIDETYDDATAAAVTRWEDSLGLDGDGEVTAGELVFVPGDLLVDTVSATVGGGVSAGTTLFDGRQTARSFLVTAADDGATGGTITSIVAPGTSISTGSVLFLRGGYPVVAIEGDPTTLPALTRSLSTSSDDGLDIQLLETMLRDGGFDPDGTMTVDDAFDDATAAAVVRWWAAAGLTVDGTDPSDVVVPAGSFVVVPGGLFGGEPLVAEGFTPTGDAVVLPLTTAAREVTTTAPMGDDTFAVGATIDVEFPDGTVDDGTVVAVGNVATNSSNTPGATPTVSITIHVATIPSSVDGFVQVPVTLRVVSEQATDAFVVPVSALLALAEGGYALEAVDQTNADGTFTSHLIGVEPGLFADGFVEVTGDQLAEGLDVVVPS